MKKLIMIACLVLAGVLGISTVSSTAVFASGGNSGAAAACQHGGYLGQVGTDGNTDNSFADTGGCVSFAAHGGLLVSLTAAAPCLNGGYAGLSSTGAQAFDSEAACVQYVGLGGTPVPFDSTPTLTGAIAGRSQDVPGACALEVSGSGLKPGTNLTFSVEGIGTFTLVLVDRTTPVVVAGDGTVNVTTYIFPGFTAWLSATTAAGDSISSDTFTVSC